MASEVTGGAELFPLSFAQQRLWFLDQLWPSSSLYHLWDLWQLDRPVNPAVLERSLSEIVRRHEILRTVFLERDGQPWQRVVARSTVSVSLDDLSDLPIEQHDDVIMRRASAEIALPFSLAHGPLLRVRLFRLGSSRYRLLLVMHHIVSDGWSMAVLRRELETLYRAFAVEAASPLPELPIQYIDYAVWQREWLRGDRLDASRAYWVAQLRDVPPLELPLDRARPAIPSFRGDRVAMALPRALVDRVAAMAQGAGATLFMALLAAFQVVLGRHANQDRFVIGTPMAGRDRMELEGMIGFFVNSLALRCDLTGEPNFLELLRRTRATVLEAHAHQDLPFEMVVEAVQPHRDLGRNPVFQVMFQLQNQSGAAAISPTPPNQPGATSPFDLSLTLTATGSGVHGELLYATDLFDRETMEWLCRRYELVLDAAVTDPDLPVSRLPLLDIEEARRIEAWSAGAAAPSGMPLHRRVAEHAARAPASLAVSDGRQRLDYRQLVDRVAQIAGRLQLLGGVRGTRVGLYMTCTTDWVAALLAVLEIGGTFVPIDPSYPLQRTGYVLNDSRASIVVTTRDLAQRMSGLGISLLLVDEPFEAGADRAAEVNVDGHDAAYVLYTSGSTGEPKGVVVEHGGLANVAVAQTAILGVTSANRVLQFASPSFDASIFEVTLALAAGASLHLAGEQRHSPSQLVAFLRREGVDTVVLTPSTLATLPEESCDGVRLVAVAGEECTGELVARWAPGRRFFNLYGPTETTIWATAARCTAEQSRPGIGRPIPNFRAYVLDRCLSQVPIGVVGELFVGGAGVARGYTGRAEDQTSVRFLPDRFAGGDARMYRSGDLVRWRWNGELEFVGRVDHQLKVRGFRIEPGEIESVLLQHPCVASCAVVARGDGRDRRLIAYVVAAPDSTVEIAELRRLLGERLPEYMVPSQFSLLPALPQTPSGKVDRARLPAPEASAARSHVPPTTELERIVCDLWLELLDVRQVGITDNFFELGGHSLLAVKLEALLRQRLGRALSVVDIFRHPTPEALARCLDTAEQEHTGLADIQARAQRQRQARRLR